MPVPRYNVIGSTCNIPYNWKFSRVLIFAVFADHGVSVKIKPTNFLMCLYGCALGLERP